MENSEPVQQQAAHTPKKQLGVIVKEDGHYALMDFSSKQHFPLSAADYAEGSIVEFQVVDNEVQQLGLLAAVNSAPAKIYQIVGNYKLDPFFSAEVMAEVAAILANPGIDESSLAAYEDKPFCTIDGADTLDLDQALFIDKTDSGFIIYYAIADAAYYVKPGSALFTEGLKRGASYYLPGLMIPMLPRELCIGVISLNAKVNRRAVVFELSLDQNGKHLSTQITRARIQSRAKLSFDEVQAYFDNPNQSALNNTEVAKSLIRLKKVGLLRLRLAEERKVARYHRTEINIKIGQDGLVFNLLDNVRNEVELYNEQLSLLCNMAGARFLSSAGNSDEPTQAIYKVHAQPPEEKMVLFEKTLTQLINLHHLNPATWFWDQNSSTALSDYLTSLPITGVYARITQAINRQALMTNNRSQFSERADKHYGVGADVYARFSAPMREIVGVFLHKELMEKTGDQLQAVSIVKDEALRDQVILMANRAKDLQNELTKAANKLVIDQLFAADLQCLEAERPARQGTIIGLSKDKLYILLDDPEIEIKLYIHALATLWNTPLIVDDQQVSLYKTQDKIRIASLGDSVQITVFEQNTLKDQWSFQLTVQPLITM
ncbi:MAG: RNB domain-containing ribonuclease [Methylococcaceae bacterium]|nr:RNB domain-containing ribonuclease [Methylococcaceae bacterium]